VAHVSSEGNGGNNLGPLPEGLPDPEWKLSEKRDPKKRRRGRPAHMRSPGALLDSEGVFVGFGTAG